MEAELDNQATEPSDVFWPTTDDAELGDQPAEEPAVTDGDPAKDESLELDGDEPTPDAEGEGEELAYLELDGKEVDLEDVRRWRDGHLMQSDYTRKTTDLAKDRDSVAAQREELTSELSELASLKAEMKALIGEDDAIDWAEMREDDPDRYIELKEKADKRKAAVAKVKAEPAAKKLTPDEIATEQQQLFDANPGWLDDKGKPTAEMEADKVLINDYWQSNGFTSEETNAMSRSRYVEACLKAARFDALQVKAKSVGKKAKEATLVTKPKASAAQKKKAVPREDLFYRPVTE